MDDLREGTGAEGVYAARVVCVFCSEGYIDSKNCMRELLHAVGTQKRIVALHESETKHGALTREVITTQLEMVYYGKGGTDSTTLKQSRLDQWDLIKWSPYTHQWELEDITRDVSSSLEHGSLRGSIKPRVRQSPKAASHRRPPTFEELIEAYRMPSIQSAPPPNPLPPLGPLAFVPSLALDSSLSLCKTASAAGRDD